MRNAITAVSVILGLSLAALTAPAAIASHDRSSAEQMRLLVVDSALRGALLTSKRDSTLPIIIPHSLETDLAAEGFNIGAPIGTLPFTRASATPREIEAAVSAGLASGIALDRMIPRPMPAAIPDWWKPYLVDWADVTGAKALQARGITGRGTAIAIIDDGIQGSHPYFRNSSGRSRVVAESCFVSLVTPTFPCPGGGISALGPGSADVGSRTDFSHGTHVAGIAAGNATQAPGAEGYTGMAPEADLVISRVFGAGWAYDSDIISALDWVADQAVARNISAVNLSLGHFVARYYACSTVQGDLYGAATARLRAAGVAIVAAAGNDGSYTSIGGPACTPGWVSVGATDWLGRVAEFSNVSDDLDILAPGSTLWSAVPGNSFDPKQGTSMASPVVAGAFGLMRQAVSGVRPDALLSALRATGPRIDDVIVKQMPTLRVDRAYYVLVDPMHPALATDVRVTTTATSATVTWGAASSGARPTSYLVRVGDRSVPTTATSHTFEGLTASDYTVSVTPRVGNIEGIATEGPRAFAVDAGQAQVVNEVGTGYAADFCPGRDVAASFAYPQPSSDLNSGTKVIRVLAGARGEAVGEYALSSDSGTYGFDITDPDIADSPVIEVQRMNADMLSPSQRLSDLFDLIPGGLPAKPGRLTARAGDGSVILAWQARGAQNWRVLVDGVVAQVTSEPKVSVSVLPGEREIAVCAVGGSGSTSRAARISVDVPSPTPVPAAPAGLSVKRTGASITATWSAPSGPVVIYTVEAKYGSSWRVVGTSRATTYQIVAATLGSATQIRVAGVNVTGQGAWSAPANVPRR